jgi:hypothetical protein
VAIGATGARSARHPARATCTARRQRLQQEALVAIEAHTRRLAGGAVHAHIRDALQPVLALLIEIGIMEEGAPVDEIASEVAHRALDFAFRLGAVRTTGARREAPVTREAEKLRIPDERAALQAQVARDHRFHLVEEQLLRHAAEGAKRVLQSAHQRPHVLARIEAAPEQPRVAEHHE